MYLLVSLPYLTAAVHRSTSLSWTGRNPEYTKTMIQLVIDTVITGHILTPFPDFLKPYVHHIEFTILLHEVKPCLCRTAARLLTRLPSTADKAVKLLTPEIESRLENVEKHGPNHVDKPVRVIVTHRDHSTEAQLSVRFFELAHRCCSRTRTGAPQLGLLHYPCKLCFVAYCWNSE